LTISAQSPDNTSTASTVCPSTFATLQPQNKTPPPNARVEPQVMVAEIPTKKMRELNEKEEKSITRGAQTYTELAQK